MNDTTTRFSTSMRVPSSGTVDLVPAVAGRSLHVVSVVLTGSGSSADLTVSILEQGAAVPLLEPKLDTTGGLTASAYFGERGFRLNAGKALQLEVTSITGSAVVSVTGFVGA